MASPVGSVRLDGQALMSFGFEGGPNTISGLGLNTFGFLWPCADIWSPVIGVTLTTWTACVTPGEIDCGCC